MDKSEIFVKSRELALRAGDEIMKIYETADVAVDTKADNSPVTEADRKADDVIYGGLSGAFDIPIVTEEKSATHDLNPDVFFIVDPLDGTKEFVHKRGDFTVNIALVEHGVPTFGIVFAPAKRRLFATHPLGGSCEEKSNFGSLDMTTLEKIKVRQDRAGQLDVVASKSHRDAATDDYIKLYQVQNFKAAGSSLKFCLVASGEAHLYPRLGRTMEWDTAAGDAVLRAAGGKVVRFDDHAPLEYGKAGFENPFFIAAAGGVDLKRG